MEFSITDHKGFQIQLPNGWTISIQFGPGNYCEHHHLRDFHAPRTADSWESRKAEIAAFPTEGYGKWFRADCGDTGVFGYQSPEQFLGILDQVRALPEPAFVSKEDRC